MVSARHARGPALAALLATACGLPDGEYFGKIPAPDPTHLRVCNSGEPEYLDPALSTSTTSLKTIFSMFVGLTEFNDQGLPRPSLATHWDISPDQKEFVFHLRRDARWSNGRKLVADDFIYHAARVLHPLVGSRNAEPLWKIAHGEMFTANRVRRVVRDSPPFRAGDIVNIMAVGERSADELQQGDGIPDTNLRTSSAPLALRDLRAEVGDAYALVPAQGPDGPSEVTLIELDGAPADRWAYVHWGDGNRGSGVYGWVPAAELTGAPKAALVYTVALADGTPKGIAEGDPRYQVGQVRGADLLMTPDILGLEARDAHTLVVRTHSPFPQMLGDTISRAWRPTPREAVSRRPKKWIRPENIVISGAFTLTEWRTRSHIELRKNPDFFEAARVRLEKITFFSIEDAAASTNLYIQGACDVISANNIPSSYTVALNGSLRGGKPYRDYFAAPWIGIYFYIINTVKFPNRHFRRALSAFTNRKPFPDILRGGEIPTSSFTPGVPNAKLSAADQALCRVSPQTPGVSAIISSGELCYSPPLGIDFDLELARRELAIAKREMGSDFPTELSIKYNKGKERHKLVAEYLQHEWQKHLGIPIKLQSQEWKTYLKDTTAGEYEIARMGWIGDNPDPETNFLMIFKCDNPTNRASYCRPEFEELFTRAERTADRAARLQLIRAAEDMMLQDSPVVPLYVYTQHHLRKPYVRNLPINSTDNVALQYSWIDPDWRRAEGRGP